MLEEFAYREFASLEFVSPEFVLVRLTQRIYEMMNKRTSGTKTVAETQMKMNSEID